MVIWGCRHNLNFKHCISWPAPLLSLQLNPSSSSAPKTLQGLYVNNPFIFSLSLSLSLALSLSNITLYLFLFPSLHPLKPNSLPAAAAKSLQSCPTLCDPIDSSPPGSPIPGILQARTLEWVAISFSNAWKGKVKVKSFSRVRPSATPWTSAYQAPLPMGFSRQEYWSGVHCLLHTASLLPYNSYNSPLRTRL